MPINVTRLPIRLLPDPRRVITRFFVPGEENRIRGIIERLCSLAPSDAETLLNQLERSFQSVHPDIDETFSQALQHD
jgi:hypothetical protein